MSREKQFYLGSYGSLHDGFMEVDNVLYNAITGEKYVDDEKTPITSFINDEYFEIYKKSGLGVVTNGSTAPYNGEPFESSLTKKVLDLCQKHGLKSVVEDKRLDKLARKKELIGTEFSSDEEFEEYVVDCIKPYCDNPAVFALNLIDEPRYDLFPTLGKIYKAIKKYRPKFKVLINLLPCVMSRFTPKCYCKGGTMVTWVEDYKKYLSAFIEETGADYIMFDTYPFCEEADGITARTSKNHILGMRIAAEFCKERNLDFYCIIQSFNMAVYDAEKGKLRPWFRKCTEADLYWQANMCMGMGVNYMLYYTYFPHRGNVTTSEMFHDDGCFLRRNGEIMPLYYSAQKINAEMQKFAPVILQYKYNKSNVYIGNKIPVSNREYLDFAMGADYDFQAISAVEINPRGALMVMEMYNESAKKYGYMIMNVVEPAENVTVEAEISLLAQKITKYTKGEPEVIAVQDGKISLNLEPGQGVFLCVE